MQNFDIVRKSDPGNSFRVKKVAGMFDLSDDHNVLCLKGKIEIPEKWEIGVIFGHSGTGKTTIAKECFGEKYITSFKYSGKSILDDMPEDCTVDDICKTFNSVGFSSPPNWMRPYSVLSNGEKMRVDLARAILCFFTRNYFRDKNAFKK